MTVGPKLRVVMVDASDRGGIARYSATLCEGLRSVGADVALAAPPPVGDARLSLHRLQWGPDMAARGRAGVYARRAVEVAPAAAALLRALRRARADVVHLQSEIVPGIDHLVLRLVRRSWPIVVTVHDPLPLEGGARAAADQARRWRSADALIVHVEDQRFFVQSSAPNVPVHVVPVDVPLSNPVLGGRTGARRKLGLAPRTPVAVLLGQIRPYKGLRFLAATWSLVTGALPDARLFVVGEAYRSDDLDQLASTPGVTVRAGFLPDQDVDDWAAAADVLVLPYHTGGHSGILHRALAVGTPVVASPSLAEEVWRTGAGKVVPLQAGAWAEALVAALGDDPLPVPKTSPESQAATRTLAIYQDVMARRAVGGGAARRRRGEP